MSNLILKVLIPLEDETEFDTAVELPFWLIICPLPFWCKLFETCHSCATALAKTFPIIAGTTSTIWNMNSTEFWYNSIYWLSQKADESITIVCLFNIVTFIRNPDERENTRNVKADSSPGSNVVGSIKICEGPSSRLRKLTYHWCIGCYLHIW